MTINHHIDTFFNREIEQYNKNKGIVDGHRALRLSVDWEGYEKGETLLEQVDALLQDPHCHELAALVIGEWEGAAEGNSLQKSVDRLIEKAQCLPQLEAIFFGEMTYEEAEISWIYQANYDGLWHAFPRLKHFQVRGGNDLNLGTLHHGALTHLIVETGGLPASVLQQVVQSELPALTHLELWLGDESYGWESSIDDLMPLLSASVFPNLRSLGLRNCMQADELALKLSQHPFVDQLECLDLSLGTLTDIGARALLNSEHIQHLKQLDVHFHYMSDAMSEKLEGLPPTVDTSDAQGVADEDDRYVSVSE